MDQERERGNEEWRERGKKKREGKTIIHLCTCTYVSIQPYLPCLTSAWKPVYRTENKHHITKLHIKNNILTAFPPPFLPPPFLPSSLLPSSYLPSSPLTRTLLMEERPWGVVAVEEGGESVGSLPPAGMDSEK